MRAATSPSSGRRAAISSSMSRQPFRRRAGQRRTALAQDVGERDVAPDGVEVEEGGLGRAQRVPARVGLGAEHARLLAARDQHVDLGVVERRGGALGGELHRDRGTRMRCRWRRGRPRRAARARRAWRARTPCRRAPRACSPPAARERGGASGPAARTSADTAGTCSSVARCGTTAGWNMSPERRRVEMPAEAHAPARGSRGRDVRDDVDARPCATSTSDSGVKRRSPSSAQARQRASASTSPVRRAAGAAMRWSSPPASDVPNSTPYG